MRDPFPPPPEPPATRFQVFMYVFFLNPPLFFRMKRLITTLQLVQHFVVVACILYTLEQRDCDAPAHAYAPSLVFFLMWVYEFATLYRKKYVDPPRKGRGKKRN